MCCDKVSKVVEDSVCRLDCEIKELEERLNSMDDEAASLSKERLEVMKCEHMFWVKAMIQSDLDKQRERAEKAISVDGKLMDEILASSVPVFARQIYQTYLLAKMIDGKMIDLSRTETYFIKRSLRQLIGGIDKMLPQNQFDVISGLYNEHIVSLISAEKKKVASL